MRTIEPSTRPADDSVGVLISRASQQISELVRQEMQLARALGAAVVAMAGKKQIAKAGTPAPEQTMHSLKADVAGIREKAHR
ncbi:hypothetical protein [Streptomyces sp. NPDC090036]|uniref:hypothetical protein n=1 Tax=Streptomyces sp. NPDC090036 TaxID=3365926 RepID=UPI003820D879